MSEHEQFSPWIVFPARVFFDARLSSRAKLFYGLLSCMSASNGYAWAKNVTLMRFLGVKSDGTVRKLLRELRDLGYIAIEDNGGGTETRRIRITDVLPRVDAPEDPGEKSPPPGEKSPGPPVKNRRGINNVSNNTRFINTPLTPQGEGTKADDMPPEVLTMGSDLQAAVLEWLSYKTEKRQPYKPTGRKNLLTQIRHEADKHGEAVMADVIRRSMAANYQGIVWDWLPADNSPVEPDDGGGGRWL